MTQGSSYPLAGIKIGQAPAHRLSTPTPKLAPSVDASTSGAPSASNASVAAEPENKSTPTSKSDTPAQEAPKSVTKQEPDSTTPKQPSKDSNEVEVTTSDQISEHGLPTNGRSTHSSTASTSKRGSSSGSIGMKPRQV